MGPGTSFTARIESRNGVARIALVGHLDVATVPVLESQLAHLEGDVRFAIALNNENPEIDRVLFENERFATVEKFYGVEAKIARTTNPRR